MRLIIRETPEKAALFAAQHILHRILTFRPTSTRPFVLGLPTGSTPLLIYAHLIRFHRAGRLTFAHVHTFNMDEYLRLPSTHPQSYHHFMHTHFFSHIDIPSSQTHLLRGDAPDPTAECARYEAEIAALGGIELFLCGVGEDGHIAFNEPGSSLASRTRVKVLTAETVEVNRRFFGAGEKVPEMAMTVGVGTILAAREVVCVALGEKKGEAVRRGVEGGVTAGWTVSALQLCERAVVVCDEGAARGLGRETREYARRVEEVKGAAGLLPGWEREGGVKAKL